MDIQENFYEADGIKMRYLVLGQGQPLLFLHGIGASTKTYRNTLLALSKKYLVMAPDLPGFGHSSVPPKVWDYEDYAAFLNGFVNSLKISRPIVLGHSFGGEIGLRMAAVNLAISKLILIGATGSPVNKSLVQLVSIMLFSKPRTNFRVYKDTERLLINKIDFVSNLFRKFFYLIRLGRISMACIYGRWDIPEKINVPALVIWAKHDEVANYQSLQKLLPHFTEAQVIKIDEYHDWLLFKPQILFDILQKT